MTAEVTDLRPLKVAVVGGGLCGLTVAIGLQRAGLDVNLYEAAVSYNSSSRCLQCVLTPITSQNSEKLVPV